MPLTLEEKKEIIDLIEQDKHRRASISVARQYYYIDNPILRKGVLMDINDMLRKADNRIPNNDHQLITDEEVDYLFTYMPIINVGDEGANKSIIESLGDNFLKKARALSVEACNAGVAWLHYWVKDSTGEIAYALVPSDQVIPVMADSLEEEIEKLVRYYKVTRKIGTLKKSYVRVEVWNSSSCEYFLLPGDIESFSLGTVQTDDDGTLTHTLGRIPFIPFANNNRKQGNLHKYKGFVDAKDIILSGYVNDVMDIQQVIYILENYAGTDLSEFTNDLKRYKTVSVGNDGIDGSNGDLRTLTIDIPVEARNSLLEYLDKRIYIAGQALPRDVTSVGNASGQALKFFYKDIDLKVGDKEVEFTAGFKELIRVICEYKGIPLNNPISFTYTRNRISNDQETAQICKDSVGVIPTELIWANHPFVDNVEECRKLWEEEHKEEDPYQDIDDDNDKKAKKLAANEE